MSVEERDRGNWREGEELPAATGTFRTSWRTVLREAAWIGFGVPAALTAFFWLGGDPLGNLFWVAGFICVATFLFFAGRYRMLGVASVDVASDAVTIERHGGTTIRIPWDRLTQVWEEKKWYFETPERSVDVREYGFTTGDWVDLSFAIHQSKDAVPIERAPGVLARSSEGEEAPEVAVYEAQRNSGLWWAPVFFGLIAIVSFLASVPKYRDGTWLEDPMLTVACPLGGLAFLAVLLPHLPQLVRRVTFLEDRFVVERYVGSPRVVSYHDVTDLWSNTVRTKGGRFLVGERNSDVFFRLLEPRLREGQVSGEMQDEAFTSLRSWETDLGLMLVLPIIFSFAAVWYFDLEGGWVEFVFVVSVVFTVGVGWLVRKLRTDNRSSGSI